MPTVLRTKLLSNFSCLGEHCPDTCCKGWSMQLDELTYARYEKSAPELLAAVEPAAETPWIMKKNPETGYCVKLEGGLCGIHKNYGDAFLGDACHFYPRVTRGLGEHIIMTATPSCPEITRLLLAEENSLSYIGGEADRLPHSLKHYLPEGFISDQALVVHRAFLEACNDEAVSAEQIYLRIASVSRSLELIDKKSWPEAVAFYLRSADARIPAAEMNPSDPFNLLHALCGLIVASQKKMSERLLQTVGEMEQALGVTLDWKNAQMEMGEKSEASYQHMVREWPKKYAPHYDVVLKRYLQMQLSLSLFPFAGLGDSLSERITLIGVRFATIRLALMARCGITGAVMHADETVRILQSLSRFLDHLGDATFSLQIYAETGWTKESRMRGLLEIK